jgi:hypothetical protein
MDGKEETPHMVGRVLFAVSKTPDTGTYWVSVTHVFSGGSMSWGVPVDHALDFIRDFNDKFRECREQAVKMMKDDTDLVVARNRLIVPGK